MSNKTNKYFSKYCWIFFLIIIEIIIIAIRICGSFFLNKNHMTKIYYGIGLAAEITAIFSLASIIIGILTYRNTEEHQKNQRNSEKLTRTINIIRSFKTKISKEMDKSEQNVKNKKGLKQTKNNILKFNFNDVKKYGITFNDLKNTTFSELNTPTQKEIEKYNKFNNVIDTINNIEQWSLYLDENMVYYNLVYRETHHDYIKFIEEFLDVLKEATSSDDKYQAHDVYQRMKASEKRVK